MKKPVLAFLVCLGLGAAAVALLAAYSEMRKERDMEATAEAPIIPPSRIHSNEEGALLIELDAQTRARIGLALMVPATNELVKEVAATAEVLRGAVLSGQWHEVRTAEVAADAARKELDRKRKLFQEGRIASDADLEAAEALAAKAAIAVDAARDRIGAAWGDGVAGREDLPALAEALLRREKALVRVELLTSDVLSRSPETVRLDWRNGERLGAAAILGPAPESGSSFGGAAFLGLVETNAGSLTPGLGLMARVRTGTRERGVVIPREAVVRHQGRGWVYVRVGEDRFTRREIPLDHPSPEGWLIPGTWTEAIVTEGAQSLLSEELKGRIQMRD